jgi:hypothetical protein
MDLTTISLFISATAIFISLMPFLKTLSEELIEKAVTDKYFLIEWLHGIITKLKEVLEGLVEKYNTKPDWTPIARILSENRVPTEKYNISTELQKKLGAVTDKYFLIEGFFDRYKFIRYYWIFIRQPDGALGEKKGVLTFSVEGLRAFPLTRRGLDELNKMCDERVQRAELLRIAKIMQDRF